jgi:hypothetical protein
MRFETNIKQPHVAIPLLRGGALATEVGGVCSALKSNLCAKKSHISHLKSQISQC